MFTDDDGVDWELPPGAVAFERIRLDNIEATAATQVRVRLDRGMIDQYTEDLQNGANFPALDIFREENTERNVLADGFHRHRAFVNCEREDVGCFIYPGGMREALIHALGSNSEHGFRRTNADKRHAVEMACKDPELSQLSQNEIADICRVHRNTVRRIQNDLLSQDSSNGNNATKVQPTDPTDDDIRDNGASVTQEDADLEEVRQMCALGKGIAYDGADSVGKLAYTPDDISDLEYVSTWCANAVIAFRNQVSEPTEEKGDAD
jgi:hypothetical protein